MNPTIENIVSKIEEYKKKYYLNQLLKGFIISMALILGAFFLINTLEYFGRFGTNGRQVLFYGFLAIVLIVFFSKIYNPLVYFFSKKTPIKNDEAALQIGKFFPDIKDKLLNTLQLHEKSANSKNELILASISQKTKELGVVRFTDAINLNENKRYLKFALLPLLLIIGVLVIYPPYFVESSKRIVDFKNEYAVPAPFQFFIKNKKLSTFKNEDFNLIFDVQGTAIPEQVYLVINDNKILLEPGQKDMYNYTFRNVQEPIKFHFEAAGFMSDSYNVDIMNRPAMNGMDLSMNFPAYLNKENTKIENAGSFIVPEGTVVTWTLGAEYTDSVLFAFSQEGKGTAMASKSLIGNSFTLKKQLKKSTDYQVRLFNAFGSNNNLSNYSITVIPDQYPAIQLEQYKDTTLYNYIILGGKISDDYGISALKIQYTVNGANGKKREGSFPIGIDKSQNIQSFYKSWMLDSLRLQPGDKLNFVASVWDNDGVNGAKSTRSELMEYKVPNQEDIKQKIEEALDKTGEELDKTLKEANQLKKDLAKLQGRLKNNPELSYQDKKQLEDLLKKREEMIQQLKQLQQKNQQSAQQQMRFEPMKPEIMDKFNQLDQIIKDLVDPETNQMYEKLKDLVEKNQNEKLIEELEKLKNKEKNLEKDLDRALKLFKKLEKEQKLNQAIKDLLEQAEKQEKLAEETEKTTNDNTDKPEDKKAENDKQNALEKKQDELEKKMDDIKDQLNDAEKLSEEIKEKEKLDTDKESQNDISKEQKKSKENLQKKNNKSAADSQKKAAKKMKNLAEKLQKDSADQEMIQMEENEDDLKQILDNLLKLSFDQELLMKDFRGIRVGDPRFIKLGQQQIKLKDDAKVIEDSLYSLASRVFQIKSFITRELGLMNYHMDQSAESIKNRLIGNIAGRQQLAMTSMNNLASLLTDALKDMQNNMSMSAMSGKPKKQKGKKPLPMLSQMQKELNGKMQGKTGKDGKEKDGKSGKNGTMGGAEELARMAQEQAKIRKLLQDLMDSQKGNEIGKELGDKMKDLIKKMDETETDIVNKNITQQTLRRQQEIETRLLESEKAMRQQEQDEQRKSQTGIDLPKTIPKELEEYIKNKQKQTELIRTVPANLSNFYKKEVDEYFRRINK